MPNHRPILAPAVLAALLCVTALAACAPKAPAPEPELVTEEVVVPEIDLSGDVAEQGPVEIDPDSVKPPAGQSGAKPPSSPRDDGGQ
jgi:hypothetical protein